jgi:DNA-binding transcriptional MerR regulator
MSKLYDLQELVDHTGLPERTVRYYLAKVLQAPGGTRGRKAFYQQETLDQLKLAKQILMAPYDPKRGEVKPSLRDFRQWLKTQSPEEIKAMAEMPYRIKPKVLLAAAAPQVSMMESAPPMQAAEKSELFIHKYVKKDRKKTSDNAAQYLSRVMEADRKPASKPEKPPAQQSPWESFKFGDTLEIRTGKHLNPTQKRQLRLAGQLLQSMLDEE